MEEPVVAKNYDAATTERCERAQLTLLSCAGPWGDRIYLAGGLVPRYLITQLPIGVKGHIGTTDVDFVVGVAIINDDDEEPYRTLEKNMRAAGFEPCLDERDRPQSFRWQIVIDGFPIVIEFIGETDAVQPGRVFNPKQHTGKIGAFNARGARLVARDNVVVPLTGRLANGDGSFHDMRVAGLTSFLTLKAFALHERQKAKDAYDVVFTLGNWPGGPEVAARVVGASEIFGEAIVQEALGLLARHFETPNMDGPGKYAAFLSDPDVDDDDADQRTRLYATEVVRTFVSHLGNEEVLT